MEGSHEEHRALIKALEQQKQSFLDFMRTNAKRFEEMHRVLEEHQADLDARHARGEDVSERLEEFDILIAEFVAEKRAFDLQAKENAQALALLNDAELNSALKGILEEARHE